MNIRWNQVAIAVAAGFLMGAFFSDYYHMHIKRRPPRPVPAEGAIEMITRDLNLSAQQKDRVTAIFDKYRPEIKKVKDSVNPRLEEIRVSLKTELKAALTPEQYSKLEKLDEDSRHRGGPQGPPGEPGPPRR